MLSNWSSSSLYKVYVDRSSTFSAADDLKPVTHLLVVDVSSMKGIKMLREGIHYLVISSPLLSYISISCLVAYNAIFSSQLNFVSLVQMGGSKRSRLGVLFNVNIVDPSPTVLLAKVFEVTTSTLRLPYLWKLFFFPSSDPFVLQVSSIF